MARLHGLQPGYFSGRGLPAFSVEDPHDTKDVMTGQPIDLEPVMIADILEKAGIYRPADRGQVEFHLDTPDPQQIGRINGPLGPFAVAF